MNLDPIWRALETSPFGSFISGSAWAFPALESLHVIAITTVVGAIAIMDLRLLGVLSKERAVTAVSDDTLRLTWVAFGFAVLTGLLLFSSNAHTYAINPYFQWKMVLIALAGINMGVFHFLTWPSVTQWNMNAEAPLAAKIAGGLSLAFWVTVVFLGRAIGFTLGIYF